MPLKDIGAVNYIVTKRKRPSIVHEAYSLALADRNPSEPDPRARPSEYLSGDARLA